MHAIFIATQGNNPRSNTGNFRKFANEARILVKELSGGVVLNDGTIQLDLSAGLQCLGELTGCARECDLSSRVLFLEQPPTFAVTPAKPEVD